MNSPTRCPHCGGHLADPGDSEAIAHRLRDVAKVRGALWPDDSISAQAAAELLSRSASTLNGWRHLGEGPAFIRAGGRVRYRIADLAEFICRTEAHGSFD